MVIGPVATGEAMATGLLVQPIIGHMSDRTWLGRLGRRRPYFLAGAILAALPTLFVYIVAGRYFVRGLMAGSVKG